MHVFKTDGGGRFHSIIITVGNDDYISKFPDILWKTESVCKLLTVGFLHEYLSKQKSILLKNLTGKKAATTWTETPLSCECALGVKNSAKWTASYQRAGIFSYAYKKKCVNIFNMLNLLNLLSKRKCFIESLTSSTLEERAAGLHNNIIILPSKKQGGHYFCNFTKNYNRSEIEKAGSPQKVN